MTLLWIAAATGWVLAAAALMVARSARRHASLLAEMYWELKYDHGELKARVKELAGEAPAPPPSHPPQGFVPLADVKKRS